ncbi:MAG: CGGC domain-containing protein [Bacillota bacterium]
MARIIIMSCKKIRDISCVSCIKCFKAMAERVGEFERYKDEPLEVVGMGDCGDCPGLILPKFALVSDIAKAYGRDFDAVHLATCIVKATTTAKCPIDIEGMAKKLKEKFGKEVVVGTHPW